MNVQLSHQQILNMKGKKWNWIFCH